MNLKLKSLAVALAMLGAGAAQAGTISDDSWGGGNGLTLGDGTGELFFAIYDPSRAQSLALDLNLTVNDFRFTNASLIDTFSLTDSTLASFIAGSPDASLLQWNLGGISNKGVGPDLGLVTTHGSAGATWETGTEGPINGNALTSGMGNAASFIGANSDPNPNPAVVGVATPGGWLGGGWAGTYGGAMFVQNYHEGLVGGELMSFLFAADENNTLDGPVGATAFTAGQWVVDGALGKVSYVGTGGPGPVVPVPAAVWLLGSGLLGLVGVARRRS